MARISLLLRAAAERRLAAAQMRSAGAESLMALIDGRDPVTAVAALNRLTFDPEQTPALPRVLAVWALSWPLDGFSRVKLALARSMARDHAASGPDQHPAARARDGPA